MKSIISIQGHIVCGQAGNSSAVFPIQRMGLDAWPIHNVQCSNHPKNERGCEGEFYNAEHIRGLVRGVELCGGLKHCSALISGYQNSVEQYKVLAETVRKLKTTNHKAFYVCEPVKDYVETFSFDSDVMLTQWTNELMSMADVIIVSQTELSQFTGTPSYTFADTIYACKKAQKLGTRFVLVKEVEGISASTSFSILATPKAYYMVHRPKLKFENPIYGVGSFATALFTSCLVIGMSPQQAFRHTNNAVYGVLELTKTLGATELQTIKGQCEITQPTYDFEPQRIG